MPTDASCFCTGCDVVLPCNSWGLKGAVPPAVFQHLVIEALVPV